MECLPPSGFRQSAVTAQRKAYLRRQKSLQTRKNGRARRGIPLHRSPYNQAVRVEKYQLLFLNIKTINQGALFQHPFFCFVPTAEAGGYISEIW